MLTRHRALLFAYILIYNNKKQIKQLKFPTLNPVGVA